VKYYVYIYWDNAGSGRHYILADSEENALKRLKSFLNEHHPFRKFIIKLEQVMPA